MAAKNDILKDKDGNQIFPATTAEQVSYDGEINVKQAIKRGAVRNKVAPTVASMTDKEQIYVYTGTEDGYTFGNWYYWNGTAWTSGGTYNAVEVNTDGTLTEEGAPADANATGLAIDELKSDLVEFDSRLSESITEISNDVIQLAHFKYSPNMKLGAGYVDTTTGSVLPSTKYSTSEFLPYSLINGMTADIENSSRIDIYRYDAERKLITPTYIVTKTQKLIIPECEFVRIEIKNTYIPYVNIHDEALKKDDIKWQLTIPLPFERGALDPTTGLYKTATAYVSTTYTFRTGKLLKIVPNTVAKVTFENVNDIVAIYEYSINGEFIKRTNVASNTDLLLTDRTEYIKVNYIYDVTSQITPVCGLTFYSASEVPEWAFNHRVTADMMSFCYEVDISKKLSVGTDESTEEFHDETRYFTSGCLQLPPNYDPNGKPVPLIYFAHGSGDYNNITVTHPAVNGVRFLTYLCDEGYAVFDCYAWSNKWFDRESAMGSPTDIACITQGIKWCMDNYNIDRSGIYVTGKSLGGLPATGMCFNSQIPVKACATLAPEMDMYNICFGYGTMARRAFAEDFDFTPEPNNVLDFGAKTANETVPDGFREYARLNASKVVGYNPMWHGVIGLDVEAFMTAQEHGRQATADYVSGLNRIWNVPMKIFVAPDDGAVDYGTCVAFLQSIKNCGGIAEIRTMPVGTGGHYSVDSDPNAPKIASLKTRLGIECTDIPVAYAEMVQFFRRFT